jgi:hypothetical protein
VYTLQVDTTTVTESVETGNKTQIAINHVVKQGCVLSSHFLIFVLMIYRKMAKVP